MTRDTLRLLIESPDLLNRLWIAELGSWDVAKIKDLPEPRLLVDSLAPDGKPLGVIFPMADYLKMQALSLKVNALVRELSRATGELL